MALRYDHGGPLLDRRFAPRSCDPRAIGTVFEVVVIFTVDGEVAEIEDWLRLQVYSLRHIIVLSKGFLREKECQ